MTQRDNYNETNPTFAIIAKICHTVPSTVSMDSKSSLE